MQRPPSAASLNALREHRKNRASRAGNGQQWSLEVHTPQSPLVKFILAKVNPPGNLKEHTNETAGPVVTFVIAVIVWIISFFVPGLPCWGKILMFPIWWGVVWVWLGVAANDVEWANKVSWQERYMDKRKGPFDSE